MTKNDLANLIADAQPKITKKDAKFILNLAFESIINTVANGGEVRISDFGIFKSTKHSQRVAKNPQNGEEIIIPEHYSPMFRPSKIFKNEVKKLN